MPDTTTYARSIATSKRIARAYIQKIDERLVQIDDERAMPAHWTDLAEYAERLKVHAEYISKRDR